MFKEYVEKLGKIIEKFLQEHFDKKNVFRSVNFLLFIVALSALYINVSTCARVFRDVPVQERASRAAMAVMSSRFYASGPLEPVPVFALKVPLMFSKKDPLAIQRAEGCIVFILLFFVYMEVVRRRIPAPAAYYSAVLFAGIPWLGYYAMTGSAFLFAMLFLMLYWDYADPSRMNIRRAALAGLFAAAACLSRTESIFFILINTLFYIPEYRTGKMSKNIAVMFGTMLFLAAPYYIWQKIYFGYTFYGQEMGLTRLINAEIQNTAVAKNYIEQPTGLFAFLFRDGFVSGLAAPFRGLIRALSYDMPRTIYYKTAVFLAFMGFYFAFRDGRKAVFSLWLPAFIPVCFFAAMNIVQAEGGIPLEYYLISVPGIVAAAGYGLYELSQMLAAWISRRYPDAGIR